MYLNVLKSEKKSEQLQQEPDSDGSTTGSEHF